MADYQRAVKALSLIVAANSRQQLLLAGKDMDVLISMFVVPTMLGDASAELPPDPDSKERLLQLLCSAYANVIDLVTGPLHNDFTEDFVLRLTSVLLTSVGVMMEEGTDTTTAAGCAGPKQLSKAQLVSSTGLIKALTAACAEFARLLMKHTADYAMVYSTAISTLHTVNILMQQWPGKRVLGRVFPPLLLPATRLALVMTQLPNPADAPIQSNGSEQQATDYPSWSKLMSDVEHLMFASTLLSALQSDILDLKQAEFLQHVPAAQHILESRDVQELCVAAFATQVRKFHIDQQGSPESTADAARLSSGGRAGARSSHPKKLHPVVAASHDKVLAILGCKNTRMLHGNLVEVHNINCYAHAVMQLLTYRMRLPDSDSFRPTDQRPPLPLPTWEAVLLLYVELQLLAPAAETVLVAQESIYLMCTLPATDIASWRGEFTPAHRELSPAVAEAMLLLVPSATQVANREADTSGDQADLQSWIAIEESYAFSLWSVLAITLESSIADLVQKQPEAAAAALEMAVRGVSIDTWVKHGFLDKYLSNMRKVLEACSAVVEQHSSMEFQPEQQSQQDRPLLQLTLTCLKSLRSVLQTSSLAMDDTLQVLACANKCVLLAIGCKPLSVSGHMVLAVAREPQHTRGTAAASASPLGFTASDGSNSVLLPLVTAARGLDILGCCFEKVLHACKASDLCLGSKVRLDLQVSLCICCTYVEWVPLQLWTVEMPTLEITKRIGLVDLCKEIRGTISSQSQQDLSSDNSVIGLLKSCQQISRPEAMAAELGPKLQRLGEEVCSALPILSCCSNHECVNTAHYTEQQLVGGKGSLCGGCRAARYCSVACQKEHRSKHRPVCNALKQARQHSKASGIAKASA